MPRCTGCNLAFRPGDDCSVIAGEKCTSQSRGGWSTSRRCGCSACTVVLTIVLITACCLFPMILSNEGFKWLMRAIWPLLPNLVPSRNTTAGAVSGSDNPPPPAPPPASRPTLNASLESGNHSQSGSGSGSGSGGSGSGSGPGSGSGGGKIVGFFPPAAENQEERINKLHLQIHAQNAKIKAQEVQAAEDAKKLKAAEQVQEKAIQNLKPTFDNLLHAFKLLDILYLQQCGELTVNFVAYKDIATHNHYLLKTKYTPWNFHKAFMIAEEANNSSLSHCAVWSQNFSIWHQELTMLTSNSKTLIEIAQHTIEFDTVYTTVQDYQGNLSEMQNNLTQVSAQISNFSESELVVLTREAAMGKNEEIFTNAAASFFTIILWNYGPMFYEQVTSITAYAVANLPVCDIYSQNPDMHSIIDCDSVKVPSAAFVMEQVPDGPPPE